MASERLNNILDRFSFYMSYYQYYQGRERLKINQIQYNIIESNYYYVCIKSNSITLYVKQVAVAFVVAAAGKDDGNDDDDDDPASTEFT